MSCFLDGIFSFYLPLSTSATKKKLIINTRKVTQKKEKSSVKSVVKGGQRSHQKTKGAVYWCRHGMKSFSLVVCTTRRRREKKKTTERKRNKLKPRAHFSSFVVVVVVLFSLFYVLYDTTIYSSRRPVFIHLHWNFSLSPKHK